MNYIIYLFIVVFFVLLALNNCYEFFSDDNYLNINDYIDVVYYINLDHRTDRKEQLLNELDKINIRQDKIVRIPAIYNINGDVGCSYSHIKTLETFLSTTYDNCIILEDDFEFILNKDIVFELFKKVKDNSIDYDVILLSTMNPTLIKTKYDFIDKVINSVSTSGYIVSRKFAYILLANYKEGVELLSNAYKYNTDVNGYAIDLYWRSLQPNNNWYIFSPKMGKQRESYSDIRKKNINYETFINNNDNDMNSYIDNIYYINLDHRTDRNEQLLSELDKINFPKEKITRISAIYNKNGDVGCSYSHIKTLETFLNSNYNNCVILEDDFEFIQSKETMNNIFKKLIDNNIDYDIIMFSSNTIKKIKSSYSFIDKIINAQTTSGYMVTRKFAPILLDNYRKGVSLLASAYNDNRREDYKYAIDQYWKLLQPNNNWYLFNPKFGKQRESYSDIAKGTVNYETFNVDIIDTDMNNHIDIIYYINLDHRIDRKEQLLGELDKVNFPKDKIIRIPAVYNKHGDVGCSYSHVKALETFLNSNYNNCLILEDDFEFVETKNNIDYLFKELVNNQINYDVLLLSTFTVEKAHTKYNFIDKLLNAQTTAGYITTRKYAPKLLDNYKEGVSLLENSYNNGKKEDVYYAVDQYWKRLQPTDNWYSFSKVIAKQRNSYSDIDKKFKSY